MAKSKQHNVDHSAPDTPQKWGLNLQQYRFAHLIAQGLTQVDAYKQSGYNASTDDITYANASQLVRRPKVQALIAHIIAPDTEQKLSKRDRKLNRLEEIWTKPQGSDSLAIAAIRVDNEMTGDNAPIKVDSFSLVSVMQGLKGTMGIPEQMDEGNQLGLPDGETVDFD